MKTIHLMLLLSIVSAGLHAADDKSSQSGGTPAVFYPAAAALTAAPSASRWLSSFQRPSWFSSQRLSSGFEGLKSGLTTP